MVQMSRRVSILRCMRIFVFCCVLLSCECGSVRMILDQTRLVARLKECNDLFLVFF